MPENGNDDVRARKSFRAREWMAIDTRIVIRPTTRAHTRFVKWSRCFFGCALVIERAVHVDSRLALNRHPP